MPWNDGESAFLKLPSFFLLSLHPVLLSSKYLSTTLQSLNEIKTEFLCFPKKKKRKKKSLQKITKEETENNVQEHGQNDDSPNDYAFKNKQLSKPCYLSIFTTFLTQLCPVENVNRKYK